MSWRAAILAVVITVSFGMLVGAVCLMYAQGHATLVAP